MEIDFDLIRTILKEELMSRPNDYDKAERESVENMIEALNEGRVQIVAKPQE